MYRPRRRRDFGDSFTLGGRVPASVGFLLALMLAMSLGALFAPRLASWAALHTPSLLGGEVWRLVSWPLIQVDPIDLIFGGLVIWFFGPPLAMAWGDRRFLLTLLGITVAAALATLIASILLFAVPRPYLGIWPIVDALVILWALRNPDQQVLIYFVLPVSGRVMAWITVGTNALFLLWAVARDGLAGLVGFMPFITAMAIAWALAGGRIGLPRRWRLGWRDWQMERQLRRRSKHLKVVRKNGEGGPPQWMN